MHHLFLLGHISMMDDAIIRNSSRDSGLFKSAVFLIITFIIFSDSIYRSYNIS